MLLRRILAALLMQTSLALTVKAPEPTTTSSATDSSVVTSSAIHEHHHHHWTYSSRPLPSRKPCSTHLSSSVAVTPTPSTSPSAIVVSSSAPVTSPISSVTPSAHHHHHHHHWSYSSRPLPSRKPCSARPSSSAVPISTPLPALTTPIASSTPLSRRPVHKHHSHSHSHSHSHNWSYSSRSLPHRSGQCSASSVAISSSAPTSTPLHQTSVVTTFSSPLPTRATEPGSPDQTSGAPSGSSPVQSGSLPSTTGAPRTSVQLTTSTVLSTRTATITACPSLNPHCAPAAKTTFTTTETVVVSTTICPVTEEQTTSAPVAGVPTKSGELKSTTSTVFTTRTATITACPSSVIDCPARAKTTSVTTETILLYTTICPIAEAEATQTASASAQGAVGAESTTSIIWSTKTSTVTKCPSSVTNCPLRSKTTHVTTETLAVGTTVYVVSAVTATPVSTVTEISSGSGSSGKAGGKGAASSADTVYTALYTVSSCDSDVCTEYFSTLLETQTGLAQPTLSGFGAPASRTPSASVSVHVLPQSSKYGGVRTSSASASSTSSAVYPAYTGAASTISRWSMLQMICMAVPILALFA